MERIFQMPVADVYPHYVAKAVRKGQTEEQVREVMRWLTGMTESQITKHLKDKTTFRDFFAKAKLNENAHLITGSICGVKIQEIEDPLMKKIRYLDKLVDEVAKGRPMEKILRS
jgi:hypothetical protein